MARIILISGNNFEIHKNVIKKLLIYKKQNMHCMEKNEIGRIQHHADGTITCYNKQEIRKVNKGSIKDIINVLNSL
jgi:hypothetical protein